MSKKLVILFLLEGHCGNLFFVRDYVEVGDLDGSRSVDAVPGG